jgi:nucleoside-triphosphatase
MTSLKKNILITGLPGVGKTTLIKKVSEQLRNLHPVGFYTAEIREKGTRKGFELIGFDGRRGILSHTDIKGPHRVGKYGVDISGFEDFLDSIPFLNPSTNFIIIDEIGKMECLSFKFRELITKILDSEKSIIATIALKGSGLIEETKKRDGIILIEITQSNRESLVSEVLKIVS